MRPSRSAACVGVILTICISAPGASRQLPRNPPIVDETSSLGRLYPDGTQEAQTNTVVDPGRSGSGDTSACIESAAKNAGATCVNVCVTMPPGSTLTKVQAIASELGKPGSPCGFRQCLGQPVSVAKAMFESPGYTRDQSFGMDRVCWVFRNWHATKAREVWLIATFKAPPPEQWREVAEAYPWKQLQTRIERLTGPSPVDCGQHRDSRSWGSAVNSPTTDNAALQESLACAQRSAQHKIPFWTAKQTPAIDTFNVDGLLGQSDGSIHVFRACLGCSDDFSMRWCLEPAVQTDQRGNNQFGCARWR